MEIGRNKKSVVSDNYKIMPHQTASDRRLNKLDLTINNPHTDTQTANCQDLQILDEKYLQFSISKHSSRKMVYLYLYDFLQHCLGNVDEEEGVGVVGGDTHELVAVVVGGQDVH